MIKINLLPYWEQKKKKGARKQIILVSAFFVLFFILIAFLHVYMTMTVKTLENKVKLSENRLAILTKITGDVNKFKRDKAIMTKKLTIINNLEKNRMDPIYLLDEIARSIPAGKIWLTSVSQKDIVVRLRGMSMSNSDIALFMINLKMAKHIESVDLVSSKQVSYSNVKLMDFLLSCTLKKG
jgi:type IV pilus assembly protein PilN